MWKKKKQRCLTFPVTVLPKISSKKEKKEKTPSSQKVRFSSPLVASDAKLLDRYPSRRNCTCGRDGAADSSKQDFPRTHELCRVLFRHLKRHGLGFVLDLELDEIQLEHLMVVCWKAFGAIDFSEKFYPADGLRNVIPVFPFPVAPSKQRIEKCYKQLLHKKETLRSTNRGEAVSLAWDDIQDHTNQDNPEGSCSEDESVLIAFYGELHQSGRQGCKH